VSVTDADEFRARAAVRQAHGYVDFFVPVTARFLPALLDALGPARGRALDLACGSGEFSVLLADAGWQPTAVDASPLMAATAATAGVARVAVGDAYALPFATGGFAAVGGAFVVPHLDRLDRALDEVVRVLVPGGAFATVTWAPPAESPFTGLLTSIVLAHADAAALRSAQTRGGDQLAEDVEAAGFDAVEAVTVRITVAIESPARWWNGLLTASFGLGKAVQAVDGPVRHRIRTDFLAAAEEFADADGGGLAVPVAGTLVSARRW
jgi:SAM-dependent methyltransferase